MSIRNKITGAFLSLAIVVTFGFSGYAQQGPAGSKVAPEAREGGMRRGGRHHRGMPLLRMLRELNLTEAQRDQARVIVERFKTTTEPQRQALRELRKQGVEGTVSDEVRGKADALRSQIREALKGTHGELLKILTSEQRTQYDQMELQWKTRREERRARYQERKMAPTAVPPAP